jgi:hypothetical protein
MMMADFGASHTAEKFFRPIRASTVEAIVVDPLHFKSAMQLADSSALTTVPLAIRAFDE